MKSALPHLADMLAARCQVMQALRLEFVLQGAPAQHERIVLAKPTLKMEQTIELLRLRMTAMQLAASVVQINLEAEGLLGQSEQMLLQTQPRRDLEAGGRALARIRAAFGEAAVTQAVLREAHLPEYRFAWVPVAKLQFPKVNKDADFLEHTPWPLMRRLYTETSYLPLRFQGDESNDIGVEKQWHGPWRISGGWWVRPVERDYYFIECHQGPYRGDILWSYYDPLRRRFLQGVID
ncbi:MAG: hypothetical protein R3C68_08965 [Myxococcota bacterium]